MTHEQAIWAIVLQCGALIFRRAGERGLSRLLEDLDALESSLLALARPDVELDLALRRAFSNKRVVACMVTKAPLATTAIYAEALGQLGFGSLQERALHTVAIARYFIDGGNAAYALSWLQPVFADPEAYGRLPAPARELLERLHLAAAMTIRLSGADPAAVSGPTDDD